MDTMRRVIAERMVASVHTSAHVTIYHEVDMTKIVKWREKNMKAFEQREGIKLTFTPFFVEAAAHALRKHPWVNASVDGTNILLKKQINVGMAVALDDNGLIVPVIKGADGLSFVGLCRSVVDLATRARAKKLQPAEIQDGTFTITNLGVFGSSFGSPIINQPQVAILGVGAIKKAVVVQKDDSLAIRSMMFLMLSIDHRIVDGALGGKFLKTCADYLEGFDDSRQIS
jgi:2-oxoglutarate dehydrogenase E2 component (dihydrolipoamide succinyltransferase)